ncbi:MAG TPA: pit accessory protein [Candidatus Saccharimonadia bacterium]|nr:pit accessory protein [Candidatus Saccharimonadia bacterium]
MFSLQTIFGKGDRFFSLLEQSAEAALQSTKALHQLVSSQAKGGSLDEFKLARQRERDISQAISRELVETFVTALEREDIEALGTALYRIPKVVEKFADRYALALDKVGPIDFAPRAKMLEEAATVVLEMVRLLRQGMKLEPMRALSEKLRAIEVEADRLMLETYRDVYAGKYDPLQVFVVKDFFEIMEKAIDRCREAGVVTYQIVLKNS